MRHVFFCILLMLGLPQVAAAGKGGADSAGEEGAEEQMMVGGGALERAADALAAKPRLDLRIEGMELPLEDDPADGARDSASSSLDDVSTYASHPDRGLSFGFEIKPRSRLGALARQSDPGDSGLDHQLERLLEQPVLGVRGRYRF